MNFGDTPPVKSPWCWLSKGKCCEASGHDSHVGHIYCHRIVLNPFTSHPTTKSLYIQSYDVGTKIVCDELVNIMVANALILCFERSSAIILLTTHDKQAIVFREEGFKQPTPSQSWEMTKMQIDIHVSQNEVIMTRAKVIYGHQVEM